jgi:hypothetical protein
MNARRILLAPALVLAVSLGLGGCGRSKPKPAVPIVEATTRPAQVTLRATGAAAVSFSGQVSLQIIVTDQANQDPNLRFVSVALPAAVAASGMQVQAGFNLVGSNGDGTFVIEPRPASPAPGTIPSVAFLQIVSPSRARYDRPVSACTAEVHNGAHSGRLECPSLADDKGKTVAFTMTWSA